MANLEYVLPSEIEKRSFEIIAKELKEMNIEIPEKEKPVTMRCIHTSADFDYAKTMRYSKTLFVDGNEVEMHAIDVARDLLLEGAVIVTDTNMAKAGVNKATLAKLGGEVICFMADEDVAKEAKERSVTRATVSMERAADLAKQGKKVIFAVGNAPTALVSLHEMMKEGSFIPDFVIGVPVGFVNVEAAKELFLEDKVPYIINEGRKGGSNIAAAICNALLYGLAPRA